MWARSLILIGLRGSAASVAGALQERYRSVTGALQERCRSVTGALQECCRSVAGALERSVTLETSTTLDSLSTPNLKSSSKSTSLII